MKNTDIKVLAPTIKSPHGEPFKVKSTDKAGVFSTWSGDSINFGYGKTNYITYCYSPRGGKVYYSDSRTGYTLTIPESGTYQLFAVAEKDYTAHNGKPIEGFSPEMLALPDGMNTWKDDGKGTLTAIYSEEYTREKKRIMAQPVEYYLGSAESGEDDMRRGLVSYKTKYGTRVREVHIPSIADGRQKTVVNVIADLHINVVTDADRDDSEAQYTNKTRYWGRDGSLLPNAVHALYFAANTGDQTVIAGDILDYLTHGAAQTVKERIVEPYPSVIMTPGGHDVTKNMESGFPDALPLRERQALLEKIWPHDLFYYSRLIKDNVLVIAMDNGVSHYTEYQRRKLEADIKKARENNYTVLIFGHEPIATGNPADAETPCLDQTNDPIKAIYNYYGAAHIGGEGRNDSSESLAVYDLIRNSADVVRGFFCGHRHYNYYNEILAKTADGKDAVIPQYVIRACAYDGMGNVTRIIIE